MNPKAEKKICRRSSLCPGGLANLQRILIASAHPKVRAQCLARTRPQQLPFPHSLPQVRRKGSQEVESYEQATDHKERVPGTDAGLGPWALTCGQAATACQSHCLFCSSTHLKAARQMHFSSSSNPNKLFFVTVTKTDFGLDATIISRPGSQV